MWTKDRVDNFMSSYGYKPFLTKTEVKELPSILHPDEELLGLLEGNLTRIHNKDVNGNGIVIATNKRIIFFRKSIIGTVTKEEVPITKVSSASFRKGLLTSSIAITTSNNDAVVEQCEKQSAQKFIDVVQRLISELDSKQQIQSQPASQVNNLEQLEKLFDLKQKGIITEDEFLAQKAKLLS